MIFCKKWKTILKKIDTNELANDPSFSNEEKAFLELIAKIIVRISIEESSKKARKSMMKRN